MSNFYFYKTFSFLKVGKMSGISQKLLTQFSSTSAMQRFSVFVLDNQKQMSPSMFAEEFGKIQKIYLKDKQRDLFCSEADMLAGQLVNAENNDFAGIIMSVLCKLTEWMPEKLEQFALKGYEIAKANGDPVHMMARLNNLRKIYQGDYNRLYDYVQVLYKQEKCLKELTNHYDTLVDSFRSVTRGIASRNDYENMLAYVQTEIGKLTRKKHPHDAQVKLLNAREIFEKRGNMQSVNYIDILLSKIQNNI